MKIATWLPWTRVDEEKRQLKEAYTQSVMKFERRRSEVERVADDVLRLMHRRSTNSEEN